LTKPVELEKLLELLTRIDHQRGRPR